MAEADDYDREIELTERDITDLIDGESLIVKIGKMDYEIKRKR